MELAFWCVGDPMAPSPSSHPICHLSHIAGPAAGSRTAVWLCEYPYRTIRAAGPTIECADCPVWRDLVKARMARMSVSQELGADSSLQGVFAF